MAPHRIWSDFNAFGAQRLALTLKGTGEDIARQGITLHDGDEVILYDQDEEIDGSRKECMLVDAQVTYDQAMEAWIALVDWSTFRREPRPN